ncbi:hypothetical protein [Microbacterium cremeum]|uniref:hypothetical protein n=1 Tax=Microbacterium cremeum TaxID=2782169 RepID=UPI0018885155|nr:hypothetical protein [Microbacterium cremeum]
MTTNDLARLLFVLGALFAVAGPFVAVIRAFMRYNREKGDAGTFDWFDRNNDADEVRRRLRGDAWWRAGELVLIGLGVALAAIASLLLIP